MLMKRGCLVVPAVAACLFLHPAFAAECVSIASGRWTDAAVWSAGHVPVAGDSVIIAGGTAVIYDVPALDVAGVTVAANATLTFDPNAGTTLSSNRNVVVEGRLLMHPASETVVQTLRFFGVDESAYHGGGMVPIEADVGLWVMDDGQLDLAGSPKTGWARLQGGIASGAVAATLDAAPQGWRPGDEISIAPTESPAVGAASYTGFDEAALTSVSGSTIGWNSATAHAHPAVDNRWTAEVMNLTRNVRIEGTPGGRAHVFVHSMQPQAVRYVQIRYMGPRQIGSDGYTQTVLGRYALHFHHSLDGSRGSQVVGTVVRDAGAHAYVPHLSHGITFHDTVSYTTYDEAYWWDLAFATPGDETHDTVYDHALAARVLSDPPFRGFRINGFTLAQGLRNVVRDSVAVGVQGTVNSSGFDWPESGGASSEHGVWDFSKGNRAHNNAVDGIFVWQNDGEAHVLANFAFFNNGNYGIQHGAYGNTYHYADGSVYGNGAAALYLQAVSNDTSAVRFDDTVFDGAGLSDYLVISEDHTFNGLQTPTVFRNVTLRGARVAAVAIGAQERNNPDALNLEFPLIQTPADVAFTNPAAAPENVVRIQTDASSAVQILSSGRTSIAPFAQPEGDHSLPQSSIIAPLGGSTLSGIVALDAYAYDDTGIAKLALYVDNVLRATATSSPYHFNLDTAGLGSGYHPFQIAATDAAGHVNYSNIATYAVVGADPVVPPVPPADDHEAPTVKLFTPAKNQMLANTFTITADAHDNFGVSKVEFYADDQLIGSDRTLPYALAWDTQTVLNGTYVVTAKAYDYSGNWASDAVINVIVQNESSDRIFANGFE
jgi:hypothetical protein